MMIAANYDRVDNDDIKRGTSPLINSMRFVFVGSRESHMSTLFARYLLLDLVLFYFSYSIFFFFLCFNCKDWEVINR